jgi:hypothetical protein
MDFCSPAEVYAMPAGIPGGTHPSLEPSSIPLQSFFVESFLHIIYKQRGVSIFSLCYNFWVENFVN